MNGHNDWYLPARNELDTLYDNHVAIGNFDTGGTWYWSSSETSNNFVVRQQFSGGNKHSLSKHLTHAVRCMRR